MFRSSTRSASQQARNFASVKTATAGAANARFFGIATAGLIGAAGIAAYAAQNNVVSADWFKSGSKEAPKTLTDPNAWVSLPLVKSEILSHNTKRLTFALPSDEHIIGLNTASALLTKYKGPNDEKPTIRPYTPVSDQDQRGTVDLLVKRYPNGPMSNHLHDMEPTQRLDFKGPIEKYIYKPNMHDTVALIAGGTGITPMWQLTRAIIKNPEDKTRIVLITANVKEEDILLKREFEELEQQYPDKFTAFYVLEQAPADWPGVGGRIQKETLKKILPGPDAKNFKAFVCGPPGFYAAVSGTKKSPKDQGELAGYLAELGYTKDQVYKF
ncbi:NADH-cytochrome b5 reductase [Savitreella phatthalungensis]